MRFAKKILSVCLALLVTFSFKVEANSLFGNTHYTLGKRILDKLDESLPFECREAFLSGIVYADIGRIRFDRECGVSSDSEEFLKVLKSNATNDQERWFVKGVEMHILQDKLTGEFLLKAFMKQASNYSMYVELCGLVDYYFCRSGKKYIYTDFLDAFDFNEIRSLPEVESLCKTFEIPEDRLESICEFILKQYYRMEGKSTLATCDDLLVKTYHDLGLSYVTKVDIHQQQANMLGAFIIGSFISGNRQEINQSLIDDIEAESERLVGVCLKSI